MLVNFRNSRKSLGIVTRSRARGFICRERDWVQKASKSLHPPSLLLIANNQKVTVTDFPEQVLHQQHNQVSLKGESHFKLIEAQE